MNLDFFSPSSICQVHKYNKEDRCSGEHSGRDTHISFNQDPFFTFHFSFLHESFLESTHIIVLLFILMIKLPLGVA